MRRSIFILGLFATLFACGDDPGEVDGRCLEAPTYTNDIRNIVDARCLSCHSEMLLGTMRNGAPDMINFDSYEIGMPHFEAMVREVVAGREPPSSEMMMNALSQEERTLISDWQLCGFRK